MIFSKENDFKLRKIVIYKPCVIQLYAKGYLNFRNRLKKINQKETV